MDAYREAIAHVPRPTTEQIRAFACFVANDHSWYKKLPLQGAGEPFFLYLHPAPHAVQVSIEVGGTAWRPIVRDPGEPAWFTRWAIGLEPGDIPPRLAPLNYLARGLSTAAYRDRLGYWGYWNWGRADQPRVAAIEQAASRLRVSTETGEVAIPEVCLELGLVYLRATVSGEMGPMSNEYEQLRADQRLLSAEDDCLVQVEEMAAAMNRVVSWAYDS